MASQPAPQLGTAVGAGLLPAANPLVALEGCPPAASSASRQLEQGPWRSWALREDARLAAIGGTSSVDVPWPVAGSWAGGEQPAEDVTGRWERCLLLLGDL